MLFTDYLTDITEVPTKCVAYTRAINLAAQVQFIDFEGRSDGESIQKIVTQLRPRRLILVRGNQESTLALQAHAKQWTDARIFAPCKGETVDVTTESHIYQVETELVYIERKICIQAYLIGNLFSIERCITCA